MCSLQPSMLQACYNMKTMASHPPRGKVRRAKVVYDKATRILTVCELCGMDVYLLEGQTVCSECRGKNRRQLMRVQKSRIVRSA
jgi:hypothetical protein